MRKNPYEDILDLPHHQSETHPHMSMQERAAQFSPFSALTGYGAAVAEAARQTELRLELDEGEKAAIDRKLQFLRLHMEERPQVTWTFFQPDNRKVGGAYVSVTGAAKKLDAQRRQIVLIDGAVIPIDELIELSGPLFAQMEQEEVSDLF